MPGLHLHRRKGRGEKKRRGPDIVTVKTGHRRWDGVEFREGIVRIVAGRLQILLAREAW